MNKNCDLSHAVGRVERCSGPSCALWSDGQCTVASLRADLEGNPALAEVLLELRAELTRHDPQRSFRLFHPPGLA